VFGFSGQRWVRFVVTASQPGGSVTLDEIALYDVSSSNDERPADTWFFMGDSITAGAIRRNLGAGTSFDEILHAKHPSHYPILIGGGIGGELATQGRAHLAQWLNLNPDMLHFLVGYGTNDSWGDKDPVVVGFEDTLEAIVSTLLDAGRVPILARIPYASTAHTTVEQFNAVIERVRAKHGLPCGPDLYAWFLQHPEQLSSDGVQPASAGYVQMNRLWAEAVDVLYPAN
jgi:lysophospholipase L1-like esterase